MQQNKMMLKGAALSPATLGDVSNIGRKAGVEAEGASSSTAAAEEEEEGNSAWVQVEARGRSRSLSNADDDRSSGKTKSARKNERRRERRRMQKLQQQQQQQGPADASSPAPVPRDYSAEADSDEEVLSRALLASSLERDDGPLRDSEDPRRKRLRNLRKKIGAAEAISSRPESELDDAQRGKVARLPVLVAEAVALESELRAEDESREAERRAREERAAESHRRRLEEWAAFERGSVVDGFEAGEDEHACPICAGPLEAATAAVPCRHVFCRACLEAAVAQAAEGSGGDPMSCVCPLCRSCLYDVESGLVRAEAAENVKRKMRKRRCTCRCGEEVALSSLRQHLRSCGDAAPTLFEGDERKRFSHKFEQPTLDPAKIEKLRPKKKGRRRGNSVSEGPQAGTSTTHHSVPAGYDEDAEIQAAILLSLEEAGLG